jgi:hypothetical protein
MFILDIEIVILDHKPENAIVEEKENCAEDQRLAFRC